MYNYTFSTYRLSTLTSTYSIYDSTGVMLIEIMVIVHVSLILNKQYLLYFNFVVTPRNFVIADNKTIFTCLCVSFSPLLNSSTHYLTFKSSMRSLQRKKVFKILNFCPPFCLFIFITIVCACAKICWFGSRT